MHSWKDSQRLSYWSNQKVVYCFIQRKRKYLQEGCYYQISTLFNIFIYSKYPSISRYRRTEGIFYLGKFNSQELDFGLVKPGTTDHVCYKFCWICHIWQRPTKIYNLWRKNCWNTIEFRPLSPAQCRVTPVSL